MANTLQRATRLATRFGERPCTSGGLERIRGMDLMPIMLNLMGASEKFGA